jgi:hypothetical protein
VLARCATEYFKTSHVTALDQRLKLLVEHIHQTCHLSGILPNLREPRKPVQVVAPVKNKHAKERRAAVKPYVREKKASPTRAPPSPAPPSSKGAPSPAPSASDTDASPAGVRASPSINVDELPYVGVV